MTGMLLLLWRHVIFSVSQIPGNTTAHLTVGAAPTTSSFST